MAKEKDMKSYSSEKCLPFEYYMKKPDPEDEFEGLIQGQVIEGRFHGPDLVGTKIDSDRADSDAGGCLRSPEAEPEGEKGLAEPEAAVTPVRKL